MSWFKTTESCFDPRTTIPVCRRLLPVATLSLGGPLPSRKAGVEQSAAGVLNSWTQHHSHSVWEVFLRGGGEGGRVVVEGAPEATAEPGLPSCSWVTPGKTQNLSGPPGS